MNNNFDFKRFGHVLAKDWKDYFRNFGISLIVWSCIPILLWIASLVFDTTIPNGARAISIGCLVFSVLIFVPSKVYGNANLSREGIGFASLPATNAEKFFSMVFYCSILTPIIVGLGSWAVDTLLTLLPFGGFIDYIILPKHHLCLLIFTIGCTILMFSSIFVFGNMIFKKRKAGKTIAWVLLFIFVRTLIYQLCGFFEVRSRWLTSMSDTKIMWVNSLVCIVIASLFYYFTYRRIKNQKY